MEKGFFASKAMYGAIIVAAGAVLTYFGYGDMANVVYGLGAALGIAGIRHAQK